MVGFLLFIINKIIVSNFFKFKNGFCAFFYVLFQWKHTNESLWMKTHLWEVKKVIWCVKHENLELKLRETMSVIGTYNKLKEMLRH